MLCAMCVQYLAGSGALNVVLCAMCLQYLAGSGALNGMGGSSPMLADTDSGANSDTLVSGARDRLSSPRQPDAVSLDSSSAGNSPAGPLGPRRRDRKSVTV